MGRRKRISADCRAWCCRLQVVAIDVTAGGPAMAWLCGHRVVPVNEASQDILTMDVEQRGSGGGPGRVRRSLQRTLVPPLPCSLRAAWSEEDAATDHRPRSSATSSEQHTRRTRQRVPDGGVSWPDGLLGTGRLGRFLDDIGEEGPDDVDLAELRSLLHGLRAVLALHTAQEEESHLSLSDEADIVG